MAIKTWTFEECVSVTIDSLEEITDALKKYDRDTLLSNMLLYNGILWYVQRIGWAIYSSPNTMYDLHPDIDWDFIMSLGYAVERSEVNWKVDSEAVWFFIDDMIPKLEPIIRKMQISLQLDLEEEIMKYYKARAA